MNSIFKSSKDQRLEVGHLIHHPFYGEGVLKGSWGDVINIYFAEHDSSVTIHDNENMFIVRNSLNSWALLTEDDAVRIIESTKAERADEYNKLLAIFQNDFLKNDELFLKLEAKYISYDEYQQFAVEFVRNWMQDICIQNNLQVPDDEQLLAISSVTGNYQVVARAGSGKTTTLVYRTLFLLKHCRVDAREILILAFNKSAALQVRQKLLALMNVNAESAFNDELRRMLQSGLKSNIVDLRSKAVDAVAEKLQVSLPFVMTFHALAYAVACPEQSILLDGEDDDSQGLSKAIQTVIDEHIRHPDYHDQIRDLMLTHFRADWEQIENKRHDLGMEEQLNYRRSLAHESMGGFNVKSFGEKIIANFLFEHDIKPSYGRNGSWKGTNFNTGFSIMLSSSARLIIEYFGAPDNPDDDKSNILKRAYWLAKTDCVLIEMHTLQLNSGQTDVFLNELKQRLVENGVECRRLSEDEIWDKVRKRAIDKFTSVTKNFIGRCRKLIISPSELSARIQSYDADHGIAWSFHEIALTIYRAYLDRLNTTGQDDFDGLMLKAAEMISNGKSHFRRKSGSGDLAVTRFIAIDEYQDFSSLFNRMVKAIQNVNPNVGFFCVGDDWQAINGFAGSDLTYFTNFDHYIDNPKKISITTNYRSCTSIVAVSNALMSGHGIPAKAHKKTAGNVFIAESNSFAASPFEIERHQYDVYTPMVLRLVHKSLCDNADVVLLSRTNSLPWYVASDSSYEGNQNELSAYLQKIRAYFPKELHQKITISTAHKYKGLEKSTVIILDAVSNRYPLIHPDWVFSRILGESIEKIVDEERRLFYVALSRAVDTLIIITDITKISPFLTSLESKLPIKPVVWNDHPPLPNLADARLLILRLSGDTRDIKELLKSSSYKYEPAGKTWSKVFLIEGFNIDMIKAENWVGFSKSIDVKITMANDTFLAHYVIYNGDWTCIFDELTPESVDHTLRKATLPNSS